MISADHSQLEQLLCALFTAISQSHRVPKRSGQISLFPDMIAVGFSPGPFLWAIADDIMYRVLLTVRVVWGKGWGLRSSLQATMMSLGTKPRRFFPISEHAQRLHERGRLERIIFVRFFQLVS